MTAISLTNTLVFICSTGFCNAVKALIESVKITELDGFTSLIQSKASNNAMNSALYTEHKSGIFLENLTSK